MIHIGYFGKTLHRGDFVRFNLPQVFVTVMDDWLQSVIVRGETEHGANWPEIYMGSPGYQFHLSSNIAGEHAWAGIMTPSVDKVGRRFPFCIAACIQANKSPTWSSQPHHSTIQALASFSREIEAVDYDFDSLQSKLETLAKSATEAMTAPLPVTREHGDSANPDLFSVITSGMHVNGTNTVSGSILDIALQQAYFNYSVWIPQTRPSHFNGLVTSGLPDAQSALALFDSNWDNVTASTVYSKYNASAADILTAKHREKLDTHVLNESTQADASSDVSADSLKNSPSAIDFDMAAPNITDREIATTPRPQIEPLELDDDSSSKAPWD